MTTWLCKKFEELTTKELYLILQLRSRVFVVEQNCVYQDLDNLDFDAKHIMALDDAGALAAYARLLGPKTVFEHNPSIGRVIVSADKRNNGLGQALMHRSIEMCRNTYGDIPIMIEAQAYLEDFYTKIGFRKMSSVYLLDGIPHIHMRL